VKYIEVVADAGNADTISAIAEKLEAEDFRLGLVGEDGMQAMRLLIADNRLQTALDALQKILAAQSSVRIVVLPVELALPKALDESREEEDSAGAAREALYETVEKNARLDLNFIVLVSLSTLVATIGLIDNNVAVVIGAMVIAPLLGPNLAFGLGTALGDIALMRKSAATLSGGIALAIVLALLIGVVWPFDTLSPELLARTDVGMDSMFLALASGAAAALSLSSGLPSVLVGVMVAVALLPPTATLGLLLGRGDIELALGAGLLLAVNVVCVNLACNIVFYIKNIRPRSWWEKEKARKASLIYAFIWFVTLALLLIALLVRSRLPL
jgi:uncharacterized hydrophobic protein (TIGR00341 family)